MRNKHNPGISLWVNTKPIVGEVWLAELGMIEKSRPVLVLAYPGPDDAGAITIVAPLTSQIRGMRGEVDIGHPKWLPKHSAINVQDAASTSAQTFCELVLHT